MKTFADEAAVTLREGKTVSVVSLGNCRCAARSPGKASFVNATRCRAFGLRHPFRLIGVGSGLNQHPASHRLIQWREHYH